MKRIIYEPAVGEEIPDGAVFYELSESGQPVLDALVDDSFTTSGTVRYDSLLDVPLSEPKIHDFAGWEI